MRWTFLNQPDSRSSGLRDYMGSNPLPGAIFTGKDAALIDDLMGEYIVDLWERLLPMVNEFRKVNPRQADKFEYLYDQMIQRRTVGLGWGHIKE